jgi:hypothetical protein
MVICSSSPAVASRCVHLRAGVGAVASQNVTNPQLGSIALQALASDLDASEALNTALASERHRAYRQLVVVDRRGNTAIHTGEHALGINHQEETKNAAAAGNMLRHEGVIRSLLYGFTSSAGRCLEVRLLDGLAAAVAGGWGAAAARPGRCTAPASKWSKTCLGRSPISGSIGTTTRWANSGVSGACGSLRNRTIGPVGWIPRRRPPTAYRVICECHAGAIDPGPGDRGAESHSNLSHDPHQRPRDRLERK